MTYTRNNFTFKMNFVVTKPLDIASDSLPKDMRDIKPEEYVGFTGDIVRELEDGAALVIIPYGIHSRAVVRLEANEYRRLPVPEDFPVGSEVWVKARVSATDPRDIEDIRLDFGSKELWFAVRGLGIKLEQEEDETGE